MDAREQRGLIIAATCKLRRMGADQWSVPSQSCATVIYKVDMTTKSCTCPDHVEGGHTCKHVFAVQYTAKRELNEDGSVLETRTLTLSERHHYPQCWAAYNRAQSHEKNRLQVLLHDLCQGVEEPTRQGRGRKPHSVRDAIFSMTYKVYCMFSSRRFTTDLLQSYKAGFINRPISGLKVNHFFEDEQYTPILNALICKSATPLRAVETKFAVDSTGFSTSRFHKWFDEKYGVTRQKSIWIKAHCAIGTKTNCVSAVHVLDKDSADCPQFEPLMKTTAQTFQISEVSADMAYSSRANFELVDSMGGTAFVPFKSNATGAVGGLFEKMLNYFKFRQEDFMKHYHLRRNSESTFSAVKRKFGDSVRSRTDIAMTNEVLCKFLAHNLTCLIQEQEELGIAPIFWQNDGHDIGAAIIPFHSVTG